MWNSVKKLVFGSYMKLIEPLPLRRGKVTVARLLTRLAGRAVYDVQGVKLELDPTSIIDRRLISGEGHDKILAELLSDQLRNGGIFVDVGANIGYFSLLAARLPNVHVLAYEPSPRELKRFYANMLLNDPQGTITIYPFGLSNEDCVLPLHLSGDANPTMNSVADLSSFMKYVETVDCHFAPFDKLVSPLQLDQVRLVKIDVEGYELSVLDGIASIMDKMPNATFVVEISPSFLEKLGRNAAEIYAYFERYGFIPRFGLKEKSFQYDDVFSRPASNRLNSPSMGAVVPV